MDLIEIRPPATVDEYKGACLLVEDIYHERGMAAKHGLAQPRANFVAVQGGVVLGSVGFRSADQGQLPAEYFYNFDAEKVCSLPRAALCEIIKLAARERADYAVFRGLIAACTKYAFSKQGFGIGLAITKPKLEKAINRFLHIPSWAPICQISEQRARAENPQYFLENTSPRPVCFSRKDYSSYEHILRQQLQGKVVIDTESFDHHRDYSLSSNYRRPKRRNMVQPGNPDRLQDNAPTDFFRHLAGRCYPPCHMR